MKNPTKSTAYKVMTVNNDGEVTDFGHFGNNKKAHKKAKELAKRLRQFATVWKVTYEFEKGYEPE